MVVSLGGAGRSRPHAALPHPTRNVGRAREGRDGHGGRLARREHRKRHVACCTRGRALAWMSRGWPKAIASSSALRKRLSVSSVTRSWLTSSRRLIQPSPCPCGSMSSGHLDERVTMMPFCTDSSSDGSPSRAQSAIVDSSTIKLVTSRSAVTGIFRCNAGRGGAQSRAVVRSLIRYRDALFRDHAGRGGAQSRAVARSLIRYRDALFRDHAGRGGAQSRAVARSGSLEAGETNAVGEWEVCRGVQGTGLAQSHTPRYSPCRSAP